MHKIIITESQLQVLQEASKSINEVYQEYYTAIDRNIFDNVINIDPFSIKTGNTKIGKGAQWLLEFIKKGIQFDFNKAKEALFAYKTALENKDVLNLFSKNIMDYKSVDDLYNDVKPLINNVEKPKEFKNRLEEVEFAKWDANQTKEIYYDNDWLFVQVLSQNSEIGWGLNTRWCTAYDKELNNKHWDKSHYKNYVGHNKRKLYVLANKNNSNEKYQLCPESDEFKDVNDREVDNYGSFSLDILEKIYNYTKSKRIKRALYIKKLGFDYVGDFENGFAKVKLNHTYNFINTNGELISKQWFDYASYFNNGFAAVKLNDKGCNFINTNGEIINNQWFSNVNYFKDGFAQVKLNDKGWNIINTNGEIISNKYFDDVDDFKNGFAIVYLNDKFNYINTNGELLSNQWFNSIGYFENGFARVYLNHKVNFINTNGEIISNEWFNSVDSFNNGFAKVNLDYKWYYIDTKANLYDKDKKLIKNLNMNNNIKENKISKNTLFNRILNNILCEERVNQQEVNYNKRLAKRYIDEHLEDIKHMMPFNMDITTIDILNMASHDMPNIRFNNWKYALGVIRLLTTRELTSADDFYKLNDILPYLNNNMIDNNFNEMSFSELVNISKDAITNKQNMEKDEIEKINYNENNNNHEYDIVPIVNYGGAAQFKNYVDWCICNDNFSYDSVSSEGRCKFYFMIRDDFETVKAIEGENYPKDDYGLSMIAVSVNPDGSLHTSTCRWNHINNVEHVKDRRNINTDRMFTIKELSMLVNDNFYNVFKPFTKQELDKIKYTNDRINNNLMNNIRDNNGNSVNDIRQQFERELNDLRNNYNESKNNKLNFLHEKEILYKKRNIINEQFNYILNNISMP